MSTLSIALTPGYLPTDGELIDNAILRLIARPTIALEGSIGAASIADGAVTTVKLADGVLTADTTGRAKMADEYLTAAKLNATQDWSGKTLSGNPTVTWTGALDFSGATFVPPPGMQRQSLSTSTTTATAITATIPLDDTIPQNTEGTEILTLAITPKATTSVLEIEACIDVGFSSGGSVGVLALFQDSTANALATAHACIDAVGAGTQVILRHRLTAGSVSATTFKIRAGTTAGTMTLNGSGSSRVFGGIGRSWLIIREVAA
jgi:hypothetical protein